MRRGWITLIMATLGAFCAPTEAQQAVFQFPVPNYLASITQDFGHPNPDYGNKLHTGQDILAGSPGMPVFATADGVVMLARPWKSCPNWGYILVIDHTLADGSHVSSIYGHLDATTVKVVEGKSVTAGSMLGQTGSYPCWKEHLHFAIHIGPYGAPVGTYPAWLNGYLAADLFPAAYVRPSDFFVSAAIETIYTANHDSNDISAFQVDTTTGTLRVIAGSPYSGNGVIKWLIAIDPSHSVLYTLGDQTLFAVDPASGALSSTGIVNNVLGSPEQMVIHPSGNFVYASTLFGGVAGFSRSAANGSLAAFSNPSVSVHPFLASAMTIDPGGRFLFVMQDEVFVSVYAIDATTGALSEVSGSPFQTGVGDQRSLVIHPSGKFLYVMGGNADASVPVQSALLVDTMTGSLTPIGQQHEGRLLEADVIDPSGRFLYGTDPVTNEIIGFQIDTTSGQLIPMFSLPVPFQINNLLGALVTQKLSIDRSGAFLYVLAPLANSIYGYSVGSSGALTPLAASPFPTGLRPVGIAVR